MSISSGETCELGEHPVSLPAPPFDRLGRYVLIERLGHGAMGVVWRARDSELGRDVALKVVCPKDAESRQRCVREARAMAAVSHRNVMPVYDVVCVGSAVAIAMKLCARGSLRGELQRGPWQERLGRLLAAARGLQAVHEAGLVHRDFKPDNIVLDDDGTPMVGDFGLALERETRAGDTPTPDERGWPSFGSPRLTVTGTVMGTPAYLAPELFRGGPATPQSDQFALCVALFEAIFECRPFVGKSWEELAHNASLGRMPHPRRRDVPPTVMRTLTRGLSADPARRWPSIAALIAALEAGIRQRRGAPLVAIDAAVALLAVAALARAADPPEIACDESPAPAWTEPRRDAAAAAFRSSELAHADETWRRVAHTLDGYALALANAGQESCRAWRDGRLDDREFDARIACLRDRGRRLDGTIAVLEQADATVVDHAIDATRGLPAIDSCLRPSTGDAWVPDESPASEALGIRLAHGQALHEAGKFADAAREADEVLRLAEAATDDRMRAQGLWLRGEIAESTGEAALAERHLVEAVHLAEGIGHWEVSLRAATMLVFVIGHTQSRFDDAERWARHARAIIDREAPGGIDEAALENNLSALYYDQARYEDARAHARRALELYATLFGADDARLASSHNALGNAEQALGRLESAREAYADGHALDLRTYGPDHPSVAVILSNLGANAYARGDAPSARDHFARVLQIRERALGADNSRIADTLTNLGAIEFVLGNTEAALEHTQRALAIRERTLPPDHPLLAGTTMNLGQAHARLGHYDEARPLLERALARFELALAPDHPYTATAAANLAGVAKAQGRLDEAERLWSRAVSVLEPLDDPGGIDARVGLGELALARGNAADAVRHFARAETKTAARDDPRRAYIRFLSAQAAWATSASPLHATRLAREALTDILPDTPDATALRAEIEAWLATHPARRPAVD